MAVRLHSQTGGWTLPDGVLDLGRHLDCQLRLDDPRVSRRHLRLVVHGLQVQAADLAASNSTLHNGDPLVTQTILRHGDQLVVGPYVFEVRISSEDAAPSRVEGSVGRPDDLPVDLLPSTDSHARTTLGMDPADRSPRPAPLTPALGMPPLGSPNAIGQSHALSARRKVDPKIDAAVDASVRRRRRGEESTDALVPSESRVTSAEALLANSFAGSEQHRLRRAWWRRGAAGILDVAQAGILAGVPAVAVTIAGLGLGLSRAGAGLDGSAILLPAGSSGPAEGWPLCQAAAVSLTAPAQLWQVLQDLRLADQVAFLFAFTGLTLGALILVVGLIVLLVGPSIVRGGPPWHRRFGLSLVRAGTDHHPSPAPALARWALLALLWPLAPVAMLLGRQGLHDWLCGLELRSHR